MVFVEEEINNVELINYLMKKESEYLLAYITNDVEISRTEKEKKEILVNGENIMSRLMHNYRRIILKPIRFDVDKEFFKNNMSIVDEYINASIVLNLIQGIVPFLVIEYSVFNYTLFSETEDEINELLEANILDIPQDFYPRSYYEEKYGKDYIGQEI